MKLINPNELMSNLIMEFDDDKSEVTKFWMDKIEEEINTCQDYMEGFKMSIKKYRKKPVEISAVQFNGWNWAECEDFIAGKALVHPSWVKEYDHLDIETLEGTMRCEQGDYIIRGIKGEFYPCKPAIFEQTYEEV